MDSRRCMDCLRAQGRRAALLCAPDDAALRLRAVARWNALLESLDPAQPPPLLAGPLYGLLAAVTGCPDPYGPAKEQANQRALELLPGLARRVKGARDPLRAALAMSMVGNFIDLGAANEFDWEAALEQEGEDAVDQQAYARLRGELAPETRLLILGDNTGEIALDRLLVERLQEAGADVFYAVRGRPILNDATLEDARRVGLDRLCTVVSSGVDTPGTVWESCSGEFRALMDSAGIIISKGQGNLEALWGRRSGIYYAFKVKCRVVAEQFNLPQGASVFTYR